MSTFTFTLPAAPLKAAVICSGYQDIRKYLIGVAIDRGHIVATDGVRLFYCSVTGLDEDRCRAWMVLRLVALAVEQWDEWRRAAGSADRDAVAATRALITASVTVAKAMQPD